MVLGLGECGRSLTTAFDAVRLAFALASELGRHRTRKQDA